MTLNLHVPHLHLPYPHLVRMTNATTLVHWQSRESLDSGPRMPRVYPRHYVFIENAAMARAMQRL